MMNVREVIESDAPAWLRMRNELWPGDTAEHEADVRKYFAAGDPHSVTFVAEDGGRLIGFLELDYRKYAPGCHSSPVPFIEGWYVDAPFRRQGVGQALVEAAEDWASAAGFDEIASDTKLGNADALGAHLALGYEEIERVACFRRSLGQSRA